MKSFGLVVAMDEKNGIGKNGDLAWRLSADLKHFKEVTITTNDPSKKNAVIMGRKTWDSLPAKFKPLPGRLNIVLSQNLNVKLPKGVLLFSNLNDAIKSLTINPDVDQVFVIGGAQIFHQAIGHSSCKDIFLTIIKGDFACDVFFPAIPDSFQKIQESPWASEGKLEYCFYHYQRI